MVRKDKKVGQKEKKGLVRNVQSQVHLKGKKRWSEKRWSEREKKKTLVRKDKKGWSERKKGLVRNVQSQVHLQAQCA